MPNLEAERANAQGVLSHKNNLYSQALTFFKHAIKLDPHFPDPVYNLAMLSNLMGDEKNTFRYLKKLTQVQPTSPWPFHNLGLFHLVRHEYSLAAKNFQKCLFLDPSFSTAFSNLYLTYREACDWDQSARLAPVDITSPFISLLLSEDPAANYATARSQTNRLVATIPVSNFTYPPRNSNKIKLGYLSRDFKDHATAHLMASLFGLHDDHGFEIYTYSFGENDHSVWRQKIVADSDHFVDISNLDDGESAKRIHQDDIDILIDLKGYTAGHRLGILARRPARIQVSYLGFPGTTGADFLDYIIADKIVLPYSQQRYYSEKILHLPHCYQVNNYEQSIPTRKFSRLNCDLPNTGFIYCSFNQSSKLDPVMFQVWLNILKAVPSSILWLLDQGRETTSNLKNFAIKHGVDPKRLIFAPKLAKIDHLARLTLADLALDTRIYGGHTTTSDCLWAGVPVVTLLGTHFASRVGASLDTEAGIPELITHSLKEYEQLAIDLARSPTKLTAIKPHLTRLQLKQNLFNTPRFVKDLEHLYRTIIKP